MECPKDIVDYYRSWVLREKGIKLHKPRFGSHVSVIRGNEELDRQSSLYRKHHEVKVCFQYGNDLQTNGDYWWLPVTCELLGEIRQELGLIAEPPFGFHLTIGREMNS